MSVAQLSTRVPAPPGVSGVPGDKLARAQSVLRQAELKAGVSDASRPAPPKFVGVSDSVAAFGVALSPGSVVGVSGSTALLLTLVGALSGEGKWTAVVGMPHLGVAAATEYGIDLARFVLVPDPGPHTAGVLAAIIDGFDVVVVGEGAPVGAGQRRSLLGRARSRRTTMFTPAWRESPLRLEAEGASWEGLGHGGGYLRERWLTVHRRGHGGDATMRLHLPVGSLARADAAPEGGAQQRWGVRHVG